MQSFPSQARHSRFCPHVLDAHRALCARHRARGSAREAGTGEGKLAQIKAHSWEVLEEQDVNQADWLWSSRTDRSAPRSAVCRR